MTRKITQARMTIDVDKATHKFLKHIASENEKSLRAVVLDALEKTYIKGNRDKVNIDQRVQ